MEIGQGFDDHNREGERERERERGGNSVTGEQKQINPKQKTERAETSNIMLV
jgi:hypothetical protein